MPHLIGNTLYVRSIAKDAVPAIKSKQALVLILLVLVFTPQLNIKKIHARIHSIHSTFKVIRACMFICSYYDRYWKLHTTSTTNMYHNYRFHVPKRFLWHGMQQVVDQTTSVGFGPQFVFGGTTLQPTCLKKCLKHVWKRFEKKKFHKKLKSGKICTSLTGSIKKFHNVSTDLNGARTIAAVCGRNGHSHRHRRLEQ